MKFRRDSSRSVRIHNSLFSDNFNREAGRRRRLTRAVLRASGRAAMPVVLLLLMGGSYGANGQDIEFGVDFVTVVPRGGFNDNIGRNGYGAGGNFLVGLGSKPLLMGFDGGIVRYGSESRRESISSTIPDVALTVQTDNRITMGHFLVRLQPRSGSVRPYVDGLVGFKYLYTRTSVRSDFSDEILASTTNFSDTTSSYGGGGGIQIRLAEFGTGAQVCFDSKVRYLRGSNAEYLRQGSIRREDGRVFFDVLSSRTDVVTVQFGIAFRF